MMDDQMQINKVLYGLERRIDDIEKRIEWIQDRFILKIKTNEQ